MKDTLFPVKLFLRWLIEKLRTIVVLFFSILKYQSITTHTLAWWLPFNEVHAASKFSQHSRICAIRFTALHNSTCKIFGCLRVNDHNMNTFRIMQG